MTRQESFKRRVRERMAKTGERYTAARKVLIDQAEARQATRRRTWLSEPEMSDDKMKAGSGRTHDEWCDIIEAWDGDATDHPAVVRYLMSEFGLNGWWAQGVTVSFERITGLRLPYQRADGTFTAGKAKTVAVDAEVLRTMLVDDDHRRDLFPDRATELRSRATSKTLRIGIDPGVADIGITEAGEGRTKVSIQHNGLPSYDSVQEWKFYWVDWLDAIDTAGDASTHDGPR